jgi:hypothetical protein
MCFGSAATAEEAVESNASSHLDKQIKNDERKLHSQVKLLLLGEINPRSRDAPC